MARTIAQHKQELLRLQQSADLYPIHTPYGDIALPYPYRHTAAVHPPPLPQIVTDLDSGVLLQLLRYYVTLLDTLTATDRWVTSQGIIDEVRAEADFCVLELRYREQHQPEQAPAAVIPLPTTT
jgi:hypothetical protein